MFIKPLYSPRLSEASYYIDSNGEAAIIDPKKDIESYLNLAKERGAIIKYIFETKLYPDFVSGHADLSQATNATIVFGPGTEIDNSKSAQDSESFKLGDVTLTALHTPGHTAESTCWLLTNSQGNNEAIFTGNTLLIDDVGKPELNSGSKDSMELAAMLYDSIQQKIVPLEDHVVIYAAQAGTEVSGKTSRESSTIGDQKKTNYALKPGSKKEFVQKINESLDELPRNFDVSASIKKSGYAALDQVIEKGLQALSINEFKSKTKDEELMVIDSRPAGKFTQGFIPGTINIGLDGRFAEWAGSLLSFATPIILVCEPGTEEEAVTRLARVGFEKLEGYLAGGFDKWKQAGEAIDLVIDIETDELAMDIPFDENMVIVDVRNESEYASGHVEHAINLPLKDMGDVGSIAILPENAPLYIHCANGYRSTIAVSLLKHHGYNNIRNVVQGWNAIKDQRGIKVVKESSVLN